MPITINGGVSHGPIILKLIIESAYPDFKMFLLNTYEYDCTIDWGDNSSNTIINQIGDDSIVEHTYDIGTYYVKITGKHEALALVKKNYTNESLDEIMSWGNPEITKLKKLQLSIIDE